jgi:hypothetical protein
VGAVELIMQYSDNTEAQFAFSHIRHISPKTRDFQAFVVGLHEDEDGYDILNRCCKSNLPPLSEQQVKAIEPDPRIKKLQKMIAELKSEVRCV